MKRLRCLLKTAECCRWAFAPDAAQHLQQSTSSTHRLLPSPASLRGLFSGRAAQASSSTRCFSTQAEGEETISVTFVEKDGKETTVKAPLGKSLLEVAHDNEVELEGACEGSLACSTCHVIVEDPSIYAKLSEPTEDELDMLDLAYGLTDTSRLGCQIIAAKELEGIRVRLPAATRNFYVDGHKPKPH